MKDKITLADGRELSWDEFSALTELEQSQSLMPIKAPEVTQRETFRVTKKELFPRIRAAAESNKISEDDLLAFIKIVHDIFYPPEPVGRRSIAKPPKPGRQAGGGAEFKPKPVITPAGRFESIADATRFYQVDPGRVRSWIKKGDKGFHYA
jgi:hypothetical protein